MFIIVDGGGPFFPVQWDLFSPRSLRYWRGTRQGMATVTHKFSAATQPRATAVLAETSTLPPRSIQVLLWLCAVDSAEDNVVDSVLTSLSVELETSIGGLTAIIDSPMVLPCSFTPSPADNRTYLKLNANPVTSPPISTRAADYVTVFSVTVKPVLVKGGIPTRQPPAAPPRYLLSQTAVALPCGAGHNGGCRSQRVVFSEEEVELHLNI